MKMPDPNIVAPNIIDSVMDGWFVSGGHEYPLLVQFEDTDAGGIVYHANYVCFAERARSAFLRCCGIEMQDLIDRDEVIVIKHVEIDYKGASRIGERLIITSDEFKMSGASLHMRQTIADREGVARAILKIHAAFVAISTGRPIRIPSDVRKKLDKRETITREALSL